MPTSYLLAPPKKMFRPSYGPVHYELLTSKELSVIKFPVQSSKLQKILNCQKVMASRFFNYVKATVL